MNYVDSRLSRSHSTHNQFVMVIVIPDTRSEHCSMRGDLSGRHFRNGLRRSQMRSYVEQIGTLMMHARWSFRFSVSV